MMKQEAENIILRRDMHIDSLFERLRGERVQRVIEPIITGPESKIKYLQNDTQYCIDL